MTREDKQALVAELVTKFQSHPNFYVADTGGLSVEKVNKLRRLCFEAGIEMQVVKNTLIRKALEQVGGDFAPLFDQLKNQSAVFFAAEVANKPAKVIKEFRAKDEIPYLKAAYVEGAVFIGDASLETLVALKSKNELIADLVALLQSPAKNVVSGLTSGGGKLAGILKTLSEKPE